LYSPRKKTLLLSPKTPRNEVEVAIGDEKYAGNGLLNGVGRGGYIFVEGSSPLEKGGEGRERYEGKA
jgi:hypothetical protein